MISLRATRTGGAGRGASDVAVKLRPGGGRRPPVVREGLDGAAAPTLRKGLRPMAEGLPCGERAGEREGVSPRGACEAGASYRRPVSVQTADAGCGFDNSDASPLTEDKLFALNTGWGQSPETWRDKTLRRRKLAEQTEWIADGLESQGIPARCPVPNMVDIGVITGKTDFAECYRAIRFLPLIAQRDRREILNGLRYFVRHDRIGRYIRYAVITGGARVPAYGPLRERIRKLHRDISRWAFEAGHRFGIVVLLRVTEFPVGADFSVHPHANVFFAPSRRLSKEEWSEFLRWTHRVLGDHWHDAGRLESPDEAIKYPFKLEDLMRADPKCLAWIRRETERLKLCQPMGAFEVFRRSLDEQGLKLAMVNRPGGARLELVCKARRLSRGTQEERTPGRADGENMILAFMPPQARFCPWAEPILRVRNFTANPLTPGGRKRLEHIRFFEAEARRWWNANGAPDPAIALAVARGILASTPENAARVVPFNVHTSRPTVRRGRADAPEPSGCATAEVGRPREPLLRMPDGTVYDAETGEIADDPSRQALSSMPESGPAKPTSGLPHSPRKQPRTQPGTQPGTQVGAQSGNPGNVR